MQEQHGYQHVWTGNIARVRLYKRSKHWDHYRDSMFPNMQEDRDLVTAKRPKIRKTTASNSSR